MSTSNTTRYQLLSALQPHMATRCHMHHCEISFARWVAHAVAMLLPLLPETIEAAAVLSSSVARNLKLLGAPGLTTIGAGIATRSKDATTVGAPGIATVTRSY